MSNSNQPKNPKSTEDILREMEELSGNEAKPASASGGGGALKSLLGFFVKVVPDENEAPPPIRMPTTPPAKSAPKGPHIGPRVGDLVAGEPVPKFTPPSVAASSASGAELANKAFDEIYREANLPPSQCSVDDLAKLLENPTIANQPMSIKVVAVNLTLSAKGVTPEAPVTDAVRRDRALDAYQAMFAERVIMTDERNSAKIQQITKEVEEYLKGKQAEMEALKAEIAAVKTQSVEFAIRRELEEKRMADLIAPFLEGKANPVTIGNSPESPTTSV